MGEEENILTVQWKTDRRKKELYFSWNEKHRAIHEEALVHFLDEHKRREKFEYQPKGKSSQVSETAMSPTANKSREYIFQ